MKTSQAVSVVILAAGNSARMNYPKSFLPFDGERKFIEKIIETYIAAGIDNIVLVVNEQIENRAQTVLSKLDSAPRVALVVNRFPGKGRFYSIKQGLQNGRNQPCFIQNIDNPFITEDLLSEMMTMLTNASFVSPVFGNKDGHPVLLGQEIVKHLLLLKGDDHNLRDELKGFTKIKVNWPFENILANINTREEYRRYFLSSDVLL